MSDSRIGGAIAVAALAVGGYVVCGAIGKDLAADPAPAVSASTPPTGDPYSLTIRDCESDAGGFPCVTMDDGAGALSWVVVWSTDPYRADRIAPCAAEDGGPVLPCVWTKRPERLSGEWLVYTATLTVGGLR